VKLIKQGLTLLTELGYKALREHATRMLDIELAILVPQYRFMKSVKQRFSDCNTCTPWGTGFAFQGYHKSSFTYKVKLSCYRHVCTNRESSSYSLTLAVDIGEWPVSRPVHVLPPGKDPRYSLDRRLGGPQSWSEHRC
jgi:hypothetical protein